MPVHTYNTARDDIKKIDKDLGQGHVSIQEASQAVKHINEGWDNLAQNCKERLGFDAGVWAQNKFGSDTFDAFGGIKQGATTGMDSVSSFFSGIDSFKGSWRNPEQARKKLEAGLTQISKGVTQLGNTLNNVARAGKAVSNILGIGNPGIDAKTGVDVLEHPVLDGIGSFGDNTAILGTAFAKSGVIGLAGRMTEDISRLVNGDSKGFTTGGAAPISLGETQNLVQENASKSEEKGDEENSAGLSDKNDSAKEESSKSKPDDRTKGRGRNSNADDFSADMISEINVVLDGSSSSQDSFCTINGEKYRLSSYSLSQELLQPMILNFSIEKENKIETQSDVIFADTAQIIGKSFEINISTVKTSHEDGEAKPQKAFAFKGMIIDVSASRAAASAQSASVTAATWDALLQNAPHCRSFEQMTLKDIIDSVLKPYSDIKAEISPRFKNKIPYIVQYNQSDYAFISMLAIRFGEWMYNTGETFVFGEMEDSGSSANLEYPGGSLMSYNLHQSMTSFSFNHLLPDYYQYGKEKAILKESAQGLADGAVNSWTDKAYNASVQRFRNEQIAALNAGGFDSGKEDEGSDSILDYSLRIEAQGKKTGIMTVCGFSKLAMLKIGQTFLIRDNVQNRSGESKDVEQKALKIIGINHSFDYRQEYSNSFTAIPVSCNYPSYSDADIFPPAPEQRAKVVENKDEQKLGRVRVQFPWQEIQSKEMKTPWLRIAVPYAGASKGQQFVPEIGEEVMVGFEMNNAERPYIIGSFYNGGNGRPDENWAVSKEEEGTTNNVKAIRTRNGHTVLFNDRGDAGLLEIYDNKNNTYHITLSADDKKITIYSAGNVEVVAKNNINVSADGNIDVIAKGNIGVNADGNIGIKSKGNISMEARKEVSIQASKVKVR